MSFIFPGINKINDKKYFTKIAMFEKNLDQNYNY